MLRTLFPFLEWFKGYGRKSLRADLISGLTVALVLIPQSMAYAQLAGLPAYYGLYAAFLPPMVAALFGSSRQLATGPVAVVSMMTAAVLEPLATAGGEAYIAYAIFLALLVGLFQLALGVFRLGLVVNFLSHPVVLGFTNAAAIIIATSQLSKIFGVHVDKAEHHYETIWRVLVAAWSYTHWPTLVLGVLALVIMVGLKRLSPRIPYVLAAVVVTTLIAWLSGFERDRVVTIEQIDSPELVALIGEFNANIEELADVSQTRATFHESGLQSIDPTIGICSSCHDRRPLGQASKRTPTPIPSPADLENVARKVAMELHMRAGLLDEFTVQIKEDISRLRAELRALRFEVVRGAGGEERWHHVGRIPPEALGDGRAWHLVVSNRELDPSALTLSGGGSVVGAIPAGLPRLTLPAWDWGVFEQLILAAIIISVLGFMEAISVAKAMAARTGQRLDPNQELIGQGLANILGSFGQSYAVSGSFSRSAVNIQAGALSGLSSVFTSAMVVIVLLFFTPLMYYLPQSALAAIIMLAVIGLVNFKGVAHAYRVRRSDGIISVIAFVATLAFAPHLDRGILIGVALSVGVFLFRKMRPIVAELSLWADGNLRDARLFDLQQCRHISVIRFDGPLFFANTSYLEDEVLNRVRTMPELRFLLFKSDGINEIDASGEEALSLLVDRLHAAGYDVCFSGLKEQIVDILRRTGLYKRIGEECIFPTTYVAVDAIWDRAHEGSDERDCPLKKVVPRLEKVREYQLRVLFVDDERDFADFAALRLRRYEMEVEVCYAGRDAVEKIAHRGYDAIILDIRLGDEDGIDVLHQIKALRPQQPVILLTGCGTVESAVGGMKSGAFDYLLKPCRTEELAAKIVAAHKSTL